MGDDLDLFDKYDKLASFESQENDEIRERSGNFETSDDKLTSFLYELLRDHLQVSVIERLVRDASSDTKYTNGWLARYAHDCAKRLRE